MKTRNRASTSPRSAAFAAAFALALAAGAATAQSVPSPMNLPRAPLFLNSAVDPNVAVTLDDSGSMTEAFIPDSADDNCAYRHPRFYSHFHNRLYYNPNVRYSPPLGPTGTPFSNASFTAAWLDGYEAIDANNPGNNRQGTRTVNLATEYFPYRNMNANVATTATTWTGTRVGHDPRLRPAAPDLSVSSNLGTTDTWATNCTNIGGVTGTANAWLPFTSANNTSTGTQFTGTTGGTSAAFYFRFTGVLTGVQATDAVLLNDPRLYEAVDMRTQSAEQQQNFANWYSYYRTRVLMSRTAISRTFGVQDEGLRVVYQNLDPNNQANGAEDRPFRFAAGTTTFNKFNGATRTTFFNRIYRSPASGATPNRAAMIRAGELFRYGNGVTDSRNPYWEGAPLSRELTCRQNFHVHVTDGFTNEGTNPSLPGAVSSVRLTTGMTLPDGRAYSTSATESRLFSNVLNPGAAGCSGTGGTCDPTLARVAFAYWATDLRPDLTNNVPPFFGNRTTGVTGPVVAGSIPDPASVPEIYWNPDNDPATWQHLVNYTVGLGVAGLRNFPGDYNALRTGGLAWPGMRNNLPEAVDDLWHAGLVSRGGYYSATDPQELVDSLSAALTSVVARRGTASAATVTSGILQASTLAFRTGFDSSDWSGQVFANTVGEDGRVIDPPVWEAGALLNARSSNDRVIITSATPSGGGVPFRWDDLPTAYQTALNDNPATSIIDDDGLGEKRVDYIRGDRSNEINNGGPFRVRSNLLGAVINSGAVVVAAPAAAYTDQNFEGGPEESASETYTEFREANRNRPRVIYVGANGGMLHAFNAGSGVTAFDVNGDPVIDLGNGREMWAYVPREVAPTLSRLTNPTFEFTPYVDNTPVVRDVFINSRWRTLLVGSLRRGGQGVFALDVTNPNIDEDDAGDVVLWEFSDDVSGGERMGFTYGRPNISRLANGKWVVIVPASYNSEQNTASEPQAAPPDPASPSGGSTLFVLDAANGTVLRRFDFAPSVSRGLTAPTMGDYESDFIDEFAVAGDLQGNLWRFDLSNPNPASWSVERMFRPATDFAQPITTAPRLFPDPRTGGLIAVFGTGKYLEPGDRSVTGVPPQALYGIRDYGRASANYPITATQLRQQVLAKTTVGTQSTFTVTNNAVLDTDRGWRIQLVDPGERAVTTAGALFSQGVAIFSTIIPNGDDPCLPGLRGNVFVLDGGAGSAPSFDRNGDGVVTSADLAAPVGQSVASAVASGSPQGTTLPGGGTLTLIDFPEIQIPTTVWRRRSWREVQAED